MFLWTLLRNEFVKDRSFCNRNMLHKTSSILWSLNFQSKKTYFPIKNIINNFKSFSFLLHIVKLCIIEFILKTLIVLHLKQYNSHKIKSFTKSHNLVGKCPKNHNSRHAIDFLSKPNLEKLKNGAKTPKRVLLSLCSLCLWQIKVIKLHKICDNGLFLA